MVGHSGDNPPLSAKSAPLSAKSAANAVVASGFFEALAADMTRIDREIKARATPTPSFEEILAKCKGPIVAMKGWGL